MKASLGRAPSSVAGASQHSPLPFPFLLPRRQNWRRSSAHVFQNRARKRERERERRIPLFPSPFSSFLYCPSSYRATEGGGSTESLSQPYPLPSCCSARQRQAERGLFLRVGPFAPLSGVTLLRTIAGRRTSARECVRQLRLIKEKFFLLLLPPSSPFSRGAIRVPRREKKSCPAPLFFASVSASRHSSVAQIRPKKECSKNNILLPTTDPAADRTFLPPPPHNECASEEGSEPPYLAAFSKVRP